jgi:hypothetical protein
MILNTDSIHSCSLYFVRYAGNLDVKNRSSRAERWALSSPAHKKVHPTMGGVKVPTRLAVATPGSAHPSTGIARGTITFGQSSSSQVWTVKVSVSSRMQKPPPGNGHSARTLTIFVSGVVKLVVSSGTLVITIGEAGSFTSKSQL